MLIKISKGTKVQLTNHFSSNEFECPCSDCSINYIEMDLVNKLEEARVEFGSGLRITSAFRCPKHNQDVGGVLNSPHQAGLAVDIQSIPKTLDDLDRLYLILERKFDNIGDGRTKGFIHVDDRPKKPDGKKRLWRY